MINSKIHVTPNDAKKYLEYTFNVMSHTTLINVNFKYDRSSGFNTVDFALKSGDKFLGCTGGEYNSFTFANDNRTTPGYETGLYEEYTLIFYIYKAHNEFDIEFEIDMVQEEKKEILVDLHSHTKCSDGKYSFHEIDEFCRNFGLDVIAITDHFSMNCQRFMSDEFHTQMLKGFELTTQWGHMGMFNIPSDKVKYQFINKDEMYNYIQERRKEGAFQIVNHPFATCENCDWLLDYEYDAIEVFNSFDFFNNIKSLEMYQEMLVKGVKIPITCGSDTHKQSWVKEGKSTHGFPTNLILSRDKSLNSIIEAIKNYDVNISYYPKLNRNIKIINGKINITLQDGEVLKIFNETGTIENINIVYNNFLRIEIWQKTSYFAQYIKEELGVEPNIEYDYIPVFATNPIFKENL